MPICYVIVNGIKNDSQYSGFIQKFKEIENKNNKDTIPKKHCGENFWLLKPAASNQGRGIEIIKSLNEVRKFFNTKSIGSKWLA